MKKIIIIMICSTVLGIGFLTTIISDSSEVDTFLISHIATSSSQYDGDRNNGSLSGYVTDHSMNPIANALVRVYFHETYEENFTDSSGYYKVTNIPICYCLKNATASKHGFSTEWVLLGISENTTHDFLLTPLYDVYVDDDAPSSWYHATQVRTIQEGIENASSNNTVFVYNGIYYENVIVNKTITLLGEDKNTTIIDANNVGGVVTVIADNITIEGFTIQNAGYHANGIITHSSGNFFTGNKILDNSNVGIWLDEGSSSNTISQSYITGNLFGLISKTDCPDNLICENIFSENRYGLKLEYSSNTIVSGNSLHDNEYDAIQIEHVNDITIIRNIIENNPQIGVKLYDGIHVNISNNSFLANGIWIYGENVSNWNSHTIQNNTINEKPIYYIKDSDATFIVPPNAGQIILANCENAIIQNQNIDNGSCGLLLGFSNHTTISNNVIKNTFYAMQFSGSHHNTISNNDITENRYGFHLFFSSFNNIVENTVHHNDLGLVITYLTWMESPDDNCIYHNSFINNSERQAFDSAVNSWDDGYPSGGNYWSDYDGLDANMDGIGDTSYEIFGGGNYDHYPLMQPYGSGLGAIWHFDEGTGYIAYDSSVYGNHGMINGASWTNGFHDNALLFDGLNDYIEVNDSTSLNFGTSDFSVTTWINTDNSNEDNLQILEKMDRQGTAPYRGFYLRVTDYPGHVNTFEAGISDGLSDKESYSTTLVANHKWHFLVATFNRSNDLSLYVDGQWENSIDICSIENITVVNPLYIGQQDNSDNRYIGILDEICIYPLVLTEEDILTLYHQFTPLCVYIDDDYNDSTPGWQYNHFNVIQEGIDAVAENGMVYVYNGTYSENIIVNKTIDLIGDDKNTITIDGGGMGNVVFLSAEHIHISGFTIQNSGEIYSGIKVVSDYTNISYNNILNNGIGVCIDFEHHNNMLFQNNISLNSQSGINFNPLSHTNTVLRNDIIGNNYGMECSDSSENHFMKNHIYSNNEGIKIHSSSYSNTISENIINVNIENGISISNADGNKIYSNVIDSNGDCGIELYHCFSHQIYDNICANNNYGVVLSLDYWPNIGNEIYHNNFLNNTINARDDCYEYNNTWYNLSVNEGNYWHNYNGTDADGDGIGDTPYVMITPPESQNDPYPFIEQDGWLKSIQVNQSIFDRGFPIRHALDGDWAAAQSFTTTHDSLTRVDVYLRRFGTPEFHLYIEIREGAINGSIMEWFEFQVEEVDENWGWYTLDLCDISSNPGSEFFIIIPPAPTGVTTSFGYEWGYAMGNHYDDGAFWFTRNGGELWRDLPSMYEFAFRTYAYN
jgi:parallel beta-helix repeat protein